MEVLHSIWDLADSGDQGALNREQFFGRFEARHGVRSFQFCAGHVGWVRHGQTPGPWIMVNVLAWPLKAYEGLKTESPVHDKMPATISYIIYIVCWSLRSFVSCCCFAILTLRI